MSPLFVLVIGLAVNALAVGLTARLLPGWETATAGGVCFLVGMHLERALARARVKAFTARRDVVRRRRARG